MKQTIKLTESALRNMISKVLKKTLKESGTQRFGGKYYRNDDPEKSKRGVRYNDTIIKPYEYDSLSDYDSDLGYHYIEPNEEPICYDPVDGVCYDTGEYVANDKDLQDDYAKYVDRLPNEPSQLDKKDQMKQDWIDHYKKEDGDNGLYANLNTYNWKGLLGMDALKDGDTLGKRVNGSTVKDWRLSESRIHDIIKETINKVLSKR